jgi:hypothetical protein
VTELTASLKIANNASLTSLAGLESLTIAARGLEISANDALATAQLDNLRSAFFLDISGNPALDAIVLPVLQKVDHRLLINENPNVTTIDLAKLATVGDLFRLDGNGRLASLAFPTLVSAQSLELRSSPRLQNFDAPNLAFVTNVFALSATPRLSRVQLPQLLAIGGDFVLGRTGLANANGFASVASVGGSFVIEDNTALRSFAGLGELEVVSGSMVVTGNGALTSFAGLDSFSEVGADLTITGNSALPRTTAQAFAASITVRGTTTIN